jgi:serine O-acetyltransferase
MSGTTSFHVSLSSTEFADYVSRLLDSHFPDGQPVAAHVTAHLDASLERTRIAFSNIHRKYYNDNGRVEFSHLNSDHMSAFLYLLGNTIYRAGGDIAVATKLFYLNKVMNGLDLYFSVSLPETFLLVHPVGSVIGNATYGDYLTIYQGCTVGADKGVYPTFGEGTILYSGVSVLGHTTVGDNVVFAANSFVINSEVPGNSVVTGQYPNHEVKPTSRSVQQRMFGA